MSKAAYDKLKSYVEDWPVAQKAAAPLKDGALVGIRFPDDSGDYYFVREKGRSYLRVGAAPDKPDFVLTIPEDAVDRLLESKTESIGEVGVEVFRSMKDGMEGTGLGVKFELHAGFFTLTRKGYLSVLGLGGRDVMHYLKEQGVGIRQIGKYIDSFRKKK